MVSTRDIQYSCKYLGIPWFAKELKTSFFKTRAGLDSQVVVLFEGKYNIKYSDLFEAHETLLLLLTIMKFDEIKDIRGINKKIKHLNKYLPLQIKPTLINSKIRKEIGIVELWKRKH